MPAAHARDMVARLKCAAGVALLLACARADAPAPGAPNGVAGAVDTAGNAAAGESVCLRGAPFVADGVIQVGGNVAGATGAAAQVGALRWEAHEGCERVVIDLVNAGGEPVAAPVRATAELLRDPGIVRITLPGVEGAQADATDASFNGGLAAAAYAVRALDAQRVFVDVHLASAAEAHVSVLHEPARIVIDLRPGSGAPGRAAAREQRVVVLQPQPGTAVYPLVITGYSRTFEANVVARLEQNGVDAAEQFTTAAGWLEAWGEFSLTLTDGPTGPATLHVGEYSARDGTWEGARIRLELRR